MSSIKQQRARQWLQKRAKRGIRGYPAATVAFYGPDNKRASKIVVAINPGSNEEPSHLQRWFSETTDLRFDDATTEKIVSFLKEHGVTNVGVVDGIIGCPHEEGIDYPSGEACPECPYWLNRDRWTGVKKS